ncbi:MAG: sigma-70 family RNA polymerase sigma factor [Lachnospiraceae bacterium]|nr:sigma-70 family RNA polymerase sigma factor [Lachnospiraceae bacterium]
MDNKTLEVLQPYCENDMRLLKRISKSIFLRFNEPLTEADYDDFYSIANMTLWQACQTYDSNMGISFEIFLRTCLKKKFATEIRDRHREKRVINQFTSSLDATNDNEEECSLLDFIPSDFDTFEEVIKKQDNEQFEDRVQQYISRLSIQQVNILNLLMDGYKPMEIRERLQIGTKEYTENLQIMRMYENVKYLF